MCLIENNFNELFKASTTQTISSVNTSEFAVCQS